MRRSDAGLGEILDPAFPNGWGVAHDERSQPLRRKLLLGGDHKWLRSGIAGLPGPCKAWQPGCGESHEFERVSAVDAASTVLLIAGV